MPPNAVLWTVNARDAEQHLADASAVQRRSHDPVLRSQTGLVQQIRAGANGQDDGTIAHFDYAFDAIGNLQSRYDAFGGYTEYFCYDALNRLTNDALGGSSCTAGAVVKSAGYSDIGNIASRSELGTYAYHSPGAARPHAVSSIVGMVNGIANPRYKYDANGNLTCIYTGSTCAGASVARESNVWWSSNMLHTLTEGTSVTTLVYGPERQRITREFADGSTDATTTYLDDLIAGAMSEKQGSGSGTVWRDYIAVDGRIVGQRGCVGATPCSTGASWSYFVSDHLGSIAVVTDAGGNIPAGGRMSFDAWGRQRNADGSDRSSCSLGTSSPTTRGFTGAERSPRLCLVNLNARLYDPTIGRFLSADSVVPDPFDAQSYNRYSYVNNRPLSFTDPTGHGMDGAPTGGGSPTPGPFHDSFDWSSNGPWNAPGYSCTGDSCHDPVASAEFTVTSRKTGQVQGHVTIVGNADGSASSHVSDCGNNCAELQGALNAGFGRVRTIGDATRALFTVAAMNASGGANGGSFIRTTLTIDPDRDPALRDVQSMFVKASSLPISKVSVSVPTRAVPVRLVSSS